jgi:dinuclear metal center YbgI/SA1388 family protein
MGLPLSALVSALETLAPLDLAEEWDNVGLLVDPRRPGEELEVERVLLTIDATDAVVSEAEARSVQCLVAYHPPLFRPQKRFSAQRDRALSTAFSKGFAIYSPHTALDSAAGGLNDWLAEGLGPGSVRPLRSQLAAAADSEFKLVVFVPSSAADALRAALAEAGAGVIGAYSQCSFSIDGEGTFLGDASTHPAVGQAEQLERVSELRLEMVCPRRALSAAASAIARVHPYEEPAWEIYPLAPKPVLGVGSGRLLELAQAVTLAEAVARVKRHLGLGRVRLASSEQHAEGAELSRIAVCAGSGGSVFESCQGAELLVTGEMRHHDVLSHLNAGRSVILCEHTNSERGYLPRLRERLLRALGGNLNIQLAASDHEPLQLV